MSFSSWIRGIKLFAEKRNNMPTLKNQAKKMRSQVFEYQLRTRGKKYRTFLRYLRIFKYASLSPLRGSILESYYTMMRFFDDVVDGDAPLPPGYSSVVDYIESKIRFSEHPEPPREPVDYLMLYCFELAERLGEDFREETSAILHSLLFDARRRGKSIFFSEEELMCHFHLLDIRGTIRATLKLFKEDSGKYLLLEPLGLASRFYSDLRDFDSDIPAGYVNISLEDARRFGIKGIHLADRHSPGIRRWFRSQAQKGLDLLEEHHRRLPSGHFSRLSRATFRLVYEAPARAFFQKVLAEVQVPDGEALKGKKLPPLVNS